MERKQQIDLVYRLCQRKNLSYYHLEDNYIIKYLPSDITDNNFVEMSTEEMEKSVG